MRQLIQANVKNDLQILDEVEGFLVDFRDTWKEMMQQNRQSKLSTRWPILVSTMKHIYDLNVSLYALSATRRPTERKIEIIILIMYRSF